MPVALVAPLLSQCEGHEPAQECKLRERVRPLQLLHVGLRLRELVQEVLEQPAGLSIVVICGTGGYVSLQVAHQQHMPPKHDGT